VKETFNKQDIDIQDKVEITGFHRFECCVFFTYCLHWPIH